MGDLNPTVRSRKPPRPRKRARPRRTRRRRSPGTTGSSKDARVENSSAQSPPRTIRGQHQGSSAGRSLPAKYVEAEDESTTRVLLSCVAATRADGACLLATAQE